MTSAYILFAAILFLGGLIAALGDRLGTKIGKARLRLFKLRPRQTAILVNVLTGTTISASTLGILFALSGSLRQGIFELDDILNQKRRAQQELAIVTKERNQVERELLDAKDRQTLAEQMLSATNRNFKSAKNQLKTISTQADKLRKEVNNLLAEKKSLFAQLDRLKVQQVQLQEQLRTKEVKIANQDRVLATQETRVRQLEKQKKVLQSEITRQDSTIITLDREIASKDKNLQNKEAQLKALESQIGSLEETLDKLGRSYLELRQARIAIIKNQVLAFGVVRILKRDAMVMAIDRLLGQANRNAIELTRPGDFEAKERVVRITKSEVEQLVNKIQTGQEYVVRIISANNYVQGEKEVVVVADVVPNQAIFQAGESLASISIDSQTNNQEEIQKRIDWLLAASKFRAERAGVLGNITIADDQLATLIDFVEKITKSTEIPDKIEAVVVQKTYTSGPLKLNFVAMHQGKVLFSTQQLVRQ